MNDTYFILTILFASIIALIILYFWLNRQHQKSLDLLHQNFLKEKETLETLLKEKEQEITGWQLTFEKEKAALHQQYETGYHNLEKDKLAEISDKERIIGQLQQQLQNWEDKWKMIQEDFAQKEKIMRDEFKLLAQQILDEKSKKFTEVNQSQMKQILDPFQQAMKAFKEKVELNEKESVGRHHALKQQLTELQKLNQQLSQEALNLTRALKGESKTQGIWGETILNRLLEKSGLEKDREYFVQQSFQAAEGSERKRVQPDVVIQLPDQKKLIIDAKVSLTAYERFINTDDETEQQNHIKQHLLSLKTHINGLAKKSYDELLQGESPEFILMFIPVEPAFSLALKEDPELYNYAFERNIVMVTPSTLLATLKIVDNMWRNEKQRKNAVEIALKAGALYDKFHGLVEDLNKVGQKLSGAQESYQAAMNKLTSGKGNLLGRVEKLKELGAKAKKQLPRVDEEDL